MEKILDRGYSDESHKLWHLQVPVATEYTHLNIHHKLPTNSQVSR